MNLPQADHVFKLKSNKAESMEGLRRRKWKGQGRELEEAGLLSTGSSKETR